MRADIGKFLAELQQSLQNSTFVKLTLANYKGTEEHLQRISVRRVETKKGEKIAFQVRYLTREVVKNFDVDEAVERISKHLDNGFHSAHLFTMANDFQLIVGKKSSRLTKGKASLKAAASPSHDRERNYRVDRSAYFLKALGITTDNDHIRSDQRDKWRQINKFVEIVDGLIENSPLKDTKTIRVVDMGSGKGYLTFAIYDYLRGRGVDITGVEQRSELVSLCNDIARASGFDSLRFVKGTIADFDPGDIDVLIALHACDTATDDALYKGIASNASIIVAAPCCHHELKKQLKSPVLLASILKHSIMLERTAETITDGVRSLLLEANGYKAKMFEFVAAEHTPKNNMLVATKVSDRFSPIKNAEVEAVMSEFGISTQHLKLLLDDRKSTN
jgi:SAM-dependent methyltransferase